MTTEDRGNSDLIAFVTRHMTCPHCDASYATDDVRVVLYHGDQRTMMATCPVCGAEQIITAFDHPPYWQIRPVNWIVPSTAITEAEVEAWGKFLADFSGDVEDLFLAD